MRANKGGCARISHSEGDEKPPNFLRLTEKKGGKKRQKQMERRWRERQKNVQEYQLAKALKKILLGLMEIGTGRWKKERGRGRRRVFE